MTATVGPTKSCSIVALHLDFYPRLIDKSDSVINDENMIYTLVPRQSLITLSRSLLLKKGFLRQIYRKSYIERETIAINDVN